MAEIAEHDEGLEEKVLSRLIEVINSYKEEGQLSEDLISDPDFMKWYREKGVSIELRGDEIFKKKLETGGGSSQKFDFFYVQNVLEEILWELSDDNELIEKVSSMDDNHTLDLSSVEDSTFIVGGYLKSIGVNAEEALYVGTYEQMKEEMRFTQQKLKEFLGEHYREEIQLRNIRGGSGYIYVDEENRVAYKVSLKDNYEDLPASNTPYQDLTMQELDAVFMLSEIDYFPNMSGPLDTPSKNYDYSKERIRKKEDHEEVSVDAQVVPMEYVEFVPVTEGDKKVVFEQLDDLLEKLNNKGILYGTDSEIYWSPEKQRILFLDLQSFRSPNTDGEYDSNSIINHNEEKIRFLKDKLDDMFRVNN